MGDNRLLALIALGVSVIGCVEPPAPAHAPSSSAPRESSLSPRESAASPRESAASPSQSSPATRGLSAEQVRQVAVSRLGKFQQCYELALAEHPELKGGVSVSGSVRPDGTVSRATVVSSSLANAEVESCLAMEFGRLEFPKAEKPTNFVFPFLFPPPAVDGEKCP